jgi:hypothetical protein
MKMWRTGLALVLCLAMALAGCSTSWISEAEEIVAALIPAASNIVALVAALQGKTISASDLTTIQNAGTQAGADLQLVQSLITAYEKADAAAQPGILNQIESSIAGVQGLLEGLLPALHIKDATTQAKITAVVGIVLSEVESLAAIIPIVKGSSGSMDVVAGAARTGKAPLSANAFVASYNATMTAKTGHAELDRATGGLRIHAHGTLVRWGTAGVLK